MPTSSPARIDDELFDSAKAVGALMSRSGAQQIAHWARLGRELEASESLPHRDVARALLGGVRYDDVPAVDQAEVRTLWAERVAARLSTLNLAEDFAGRSYVELDDDGSVVEQVPSPLSSADPVLHVLAGPNGAGKTTFVQHVLAPVTHLPFVNADVIAVERWPDDVVARSYDAAELAAAERSRLIAAQQSFLSETVFSHPSKLDLLRAARAQRFLVTLHVILVPVELSVARVRSRDGRAVGPTHWPSWTPPELRQA